MMIGCVRSCLVVAALNATMGVGCGSGAETSSDNQSQDAAGSADSSGGAAKTKCGNAASRAACLGYVVEGSSTTCREVTGSLFESPEQAEAWKDSCVGPLVASCSQVAVYGRCIYDCGTSTENIVYTYDAASGEPNKINCARYDGVWDGP